MLSRNTLCLRPIGYCAQFFQLQVQWMNKFVLHWAEESCFNFCLFQRLAVSSKTASHHRADCHDSLDCSKSHWRKFNPPSSKFNRASWEEIIKSHQDRIMVVGSNPRKHPLGWHVRRGRECSFLFQVKLDKKINKSIARKNLLVRSHEVESIHEWTRSLHRNSGCISRNEIKPGKGNYTRKNCFGLFYFFALLCFGKC